MQIPKNTMGIAACAELGRHPELIFIALQTIQFYFHIPKSNNTILREVFLEDTNLDATNKHSFASSIRILVEKCGKENLTPSLTNILDDNKQNDILSTIQKNLRDEYVENFMRAINRYKGVTHVGGNKLRTYAKIKKALI